ncbi:MAG: chemotaxis protein CheX [Candidatus Hydrogenedentes bacterium]|nr:chemotaxis protein CheX [Candidatus Hydrogenedentota bacterium]
MQMKVENINPFIESVYDLFSTMLNAKTERKTVGIATTANPRDIMALIGISGRVRGVVGLAFPVSTALAMVGRLLGTEIKVIDDTVSDAIAEMVNIVAGGAKARLNKGDEPPLDLSLPTVIRGGDFSVEFPTNSVWLEINFESELGPFTLRVTFESEKK